nr:VWA domain-containing protein [uncultured Hyphomonas sp.]
MIRITRTPADEYEMPEGDGPSARYERLRRLLTGRVSAPTMSLFPEPKAVADGGIDWISNLGGQPVALTSLPEEQQLAATSILDERLQGLRVAAQDLEQTSPADAAFLREVASRPSDKDVFVLNGQPTIVGWGLRRPGEVDIPPAAAAATAADIAPEVEARPKRWWLWGILGGLLLIAALVAAWWLFLRGDPYADLLAKVEVADCAELQDIRSRKGLFKLDDERYVVLLVDVDRRLADCAYEKVKSQVEAAEKDCEALEDLREIDILMSSQEDRYKVLRERVDSQLLDCTYERVKNTVETAECPALRPLLASEPYLAKPPEQRFMELRAAALTRGADCEYERISAAVEEYEGQCEPTQELLDGEAYLLSPPEERYSVLRASVDNTLLECRIADLREKLEAADCEEVRQLYETEPLLALDDPRIAELREIGDEKIADCEFGEVEDAVNEAMGDCKAMSSLLAGEPRLNNAAPRFKALRSKLNKDLMACKAQQAKDALDQCAGERPEELAPQLVVVMDQSGSMDTSMGITQAMQDRWNRMIQVNSLLGTIQAAAEKEQIIASTPSRMTVAKDALRMVVSTLPSDVPVGLVEVSDCTRAINHGFFRPSQRGSLLSIINRASPKNGTPLADGVSRAGNLITDKNRPAVMVVVSDGDESCGGNVCAVGQSLARSHPKLTINVVDILGVGAANCLAEATGGKVYPANNAADVASTMERAASEALGPQRCRKK